MAKDLNCVLKNRIILGIYVLRNINKNVIVGFYLQEDLLK